MTVTPDLAYEPGPQQIWAFEPAPQPAVRRAPAIAPRRAPQRALLAAAAPAPNTGLHGAVVKSLAGVNALMLVMFAATFRGDKEALFMVAISAAYLLAYMGTPFLMGRVGGKHLNHDKPLVQFLAEPFETWTGIISGREAMTQVLMVPVAMMLAVAGMCLIITAHQ